MDTNGRFNLYGTKCLLTKAFVILVFDVTDKRSFIELEDYIEDFNRYNMNPNKLLYIVGNKCDNENNRKISYEEAQEFALD